MGLVRVHTRLRGRILPPNSLSILTCIFLCVCVLGGGGDKYLFTHVCADAYLLMSFPVIFTGIPLVVYCNPYKLK